MRRARLSARASREREAHEMGSVVCDGEQRDAIHAVDGRSDDRGETRRWDHISRVQMVYCSHGEVGIEAYFFYRQFSPSKQTGH